MTAMPPRSAVNIVRQWDDDELGVPGADQVLEWHDALAALDRATLFWLVCHPEIGPVHVRPVFAVVDDGRIAVASSTGARKSALLLDDPRCVLATSTDHLDLSVAGRATRVDDPDALRRIADRYRSKYDWPASLTGDERALHAPFGAPTAGPPPYLVFAIEPTVAHGFGTDEHHARRSTRWDFG